MPRRTQRPRKIRRRAARPRPGDLRRRATRDDAAVLASIAAGRAELLRIHRAGLIEDEVLHNLERDLDVEELGMILQLSDGSDLPD